MNINIDLDRNTRKIITTTTTTSTTMPKAAPAVVTAAQTRSGANAETTSQKKTTGSGPHPLRQRPEETTLPAIPKNDNILPPALRAKPGPGLSYGSPWHYSSLTINYWSSSIMPHKNKKTMLEQKQIVEKNSRGICDVNAHTNSQVTAEVVRPPLTSMSAQQISLTSRVNILGILQVGNRTTVKTTKASTASYTSTMDKTRKATPEFVTATESVSTSAAEPVSSSFTLTSTASQTCVESRVFCPSIKMPLRRLLLTIMAAVVLSMEFTICNSSAIESRRVSVQQHAPADTTINITTKNIESPTNIPVTTTTRMTWAKSAVPSPQHHIGPVASSSTVAASRQMKSMRLLETAALIESSPTTLSHLTAPASAASSSYATMDAMESSSSLLTSAHLTDTTVMHSDTSQFDDVNASSELSSYPTSVLKTFDGSDLPPLTEAEQAAKDLLTKGFSIPTYLPPFPVFAVADLPAYLNTVSTTTTESPGNINSNENLLYYDNITGDHHHQQNQHRKLQIPRRNTSLLGANNVTVQEGNHAYLPCRIHRLQNKPVSWVRMRDGHIISVDQTTFIADQRFQAIFQDDKEYTWSLQVKYVQPIDEGWYECQASSEPKMSARVYLKVVVPFTELIGDQSRFVKAGSKVALHCIVRGTLEPPQYIIWYRDKTQISEDNKMGWFTQLDRNIFGHNGDNENTIGSLIIPFVRKVDSGNYTCQPSNSAAVSVDLHVLSGEYSASAIMSAATRTTTYKIKDSYLLVMVVTLLLLISLNSNT